ncbi:MAG: 5-formyltetrahydrofolate cyclo-ligase [Lachnospiraceae bacterium]|nr:5-formyltetrahydrofolate cyclo-ligase [Lachnospiraceae bacterium]
MEVKRDKKEFRKEALKKRDGLLEGYILRASLLIEDKICKAVLSKNLSCIGLYASYRSEVRTDGLIKKLLAMDKRLCLPRSLKENELPILKFYQIKDTETDIISGYKGIGEPDPKRCKEVLKEEMDMIIVPGVCFGKDRSRMGYGAGFYDRYLMDFSGEKVGISFEEMVYDSIPFDERDIPLQAVVTEERTY